jgi:hydrogenase maturation protease
MGERILIAGIGNIFFGDDAFGVEVIRALFHRPQTAGVRIADFGIRSLDLAYALLDPWDAVILVDAVPRGEPPGTLYTIQADLHTLRGGEVPGVAIDAHTMDPVKVLQLAASLGEIPRRVYVIGCEPGDCGGEQGRMGLTAEVEAAIPEAVQMIEDLVRRIREITSAAVTENPVHEVR